jgi:hypothetical protein
VLDSSFLPSAVVVITVVLFPKRVKIYFRRRVQLRPSAVLGNRKAQIIIRSTLVPQPYAQQSSSTSTTSEISAKRASKPKLCDLGMDAEPQGKIALAFDQLHPLSQRSARLSVELTELEKRMRRKLFVRGGDELGPPKPKGRSARSGS